MFAPKNFNLSEELINASRKVMEQKYQVVEEETELNEEEEALFEAFEEFLEENFYVDQLTEEEVEYLLDMFINEADEEKGTVGSRLDTAGWNKERRSNQAEVDRYLGPGVKAGSAEANMKLDTYNKERGTFGKVADKISDAFSSYSPKSTSTSQPQQKSTTPASTPKTPTELKREAPVGGLSGSPGSEDWVKGGQQGKPNAPGSAADAAQKRSAPTPQRPQQSRQQTPSMSARKPSSSDGDVIGRTGTSYGKGGEWKRSAMEPSTGG